MKDVKVIAGQIWYSSFSDKNVTMTKGDENRFTNGAPRYTFVPQSDLEWLAVEFGDREWPSNELTHVSKYCGITFHNQPATNRFNHEELQKMRYDLGLDDKPVSEGEWLNIHDSGASYRGRMNTQEAQDQLKGFFEHCDRIGYNKKETKMIDLSTAKVGDEYVDRAGEICKLVYRTDRDTCFEIGSSGLLVTIDHDGGCGMFQARQLVSKHEPRWWMKYFPNADLFEDDIYLYYSSNGLWCYSKHSKTLNEESLSWTGSLICLSGIKMPTLTGDEWKLSKISIADLKSWQLNNKDKS